MRAAAVGAAAAAALLWFPSRATAQVCEGRFIRTITIENAGLFDNDSRVPRWVVALSSALSWRVQPSVIESDLLFHAGDACDRYVMSETEQLLRRRPYLRSATIRAGAVTDSAVDVVIATRDDWSLGGDLSVSTKQGGSLRSFRLTETNLLGQGVLARARFDNRGREPGLVFDLLHRHVLGGRNHIELNAGQTSVGPLVALAMYGPFETEIDRFGWFAGGSRAEEPFGLHADTLGAVTVPRLRETYGVNAEWRLGPEQLQMVGGVSVMYVRVSQAGSAMATDPADDAAAQAAVQSMIADVERFSTTLVLGARSMRRATHSRLDAVNAVEEVREGLEVRVAGGRGLAVGGLESDWFAMAEGYAGTHVAGPALLFGRVRGEGLRRGGANRWHDLIAAGDVFSYVPMGRRGVLVLSAQAAGGWRVRQPFQLSLGEGEGMRGFGRGQPVGRRLLGHSEYRHYAGTVRGVGDIGWAAFVDAGRGWAGDAPFGTHRGWRASVGGGLRFALPPGSKYVARMDLAVPLTGGAVELRFSTRQQFSILKPEPSDIRRSRQPLSTQPPFNSFPY